MAKGTRRGSGQGKAGKKSPRRRQPPRRQHLPRVASRVRDRDEEFDTAEKAYAEAERRIAAAQASHATELDVELRYLSLIPRVADRPHCPADPLARPYASGRPRPMAGLTALQHLALDGTRVADLAPLAGLTALQSLSLDRTPVADLAPLAGLTALQTLSLDRTRVADLAPLAGLTALENLSLDHTRVVDLETNCGTHFLKSIEFAGNQIHPYALSSGVIVSH